MTSVLVLKQVWLDAILHGEKRMELRGCASRKVGQTIYLMASKTNSITGKATIASCKPLTEDEFQQARALHKSTAASKPYKKTFGWMLTNVECIVPLHHVRKRGCIGFSVYEKAETA